MKVFISYRFTGEDPRQLKPILENISKSLEKAGHSSFCSFWKGDYYKEKKFTKKQILNYALNELEKSDIYLAFIKSEEKSEGLLVEAGYALSKNKKFYTAIKKGIETTFMKDMADKVIEFENFDELYEKLSKLK
jgi:nucleoside 2-deoxyribosyltransferase